MDDWRLERDEGEEESAPVRKRTERAVKRPSNRIEGFQALESHDIGGADGTHPYHDLLSPPLRPPRPK